MTAPLHAAYYADRALHRKVPVVENERIAHSTYRVRLASPEIARRIVPGQFVMLRLNKYDDPLLGRPLALYDTALDKHGEPAAIDIVYLVIGKFTSKLAAVAPGTEMELWGPLGNGFSPQSASHLVMVAGGIGQTPFMAVAHEARGLRRYGDPQRKAAPAERITLCYGARTRELLAGVDDFERLGVEVQISTDDGTAGHHGLVTDLLDGVLRQAGGESLSVLTCGPERMMEAVAEVALAAGVPCHVSLETPMACGIGICFSCVAKLRQPDGDWDYKRTCVEGPIFDADKIVW